MDFSQTTILICISYALSRPTSLKVQFLGLCEGTRIKYGTCYMVHIIWSPYCMVHIIWSLYYYMESILYGPYYMEQHLTPVIFRTDGCSSYSVIFGELHLRRISRHFSCASILIVPTVIPFQLLIDVTIYPKTTCLIVYF